MIAAIASEYRKFFSTRMWWILTLAMAAYFLLIAAIMGWVFAYQATHGGFGGLPAGMAGAVRDAVYGMGPSMGYVFPVIIGAIAVTAEYRHSTIVPTFLGEPRRPVVMVAKAIASIPMGAVVGLVGALSCVAGGGLGFWIGGIDPMIWTVATWKIVGLSVVANVLWALVGVALGMLVISQVGVIIAALAFTQLVEPMARLGLSFFPSVAGIAKFFPGAASDAVTGGASIYTMMTAMGSGGSLTIWQGGLVLLAYAVVLGVLGYVLRIRRDVG